MSEFLDMVNGESVELDEHGFLLNQSVWTKEVALSFAREDGVQLTDAHWTVIEVLRDYFDEFEIEPPMRALVKELKKRGGEAFANSLALYRMFPEGPVKQGSRYAGLPIPVSCI